MIFLVGGNIGEDDKPRIGIRVLIVDERPLTTYEKAYIDLVVERTVAVEELLTLGDVERLIRRLKQEAAIAWPVCDVCENRHASTGPCRGLLEVVVDAGGVEWRR